MLLKRPISLERVAYDGALRWQETKRLPYYERTLRGFVSRFWHAWLVLRGKAVAAVKKHTELSHDS